MEIIRSKEAVYQYLIEPSHLFLKQVVDIAETRNYIMVMDIRNIKNRVIPQTVIAKFEERLQSLRQHSYKDKEYDGVNYFLISKVPTNESLSKSSTTGV